MDFTLSLKKMMGVFEIGDLIKTLKILLMEASPSPMCNLSIRSAIFVLGMASESGPPSIHNALLVVTGS
jgi:hypothetical protein